MEQSEASTGSVVEEAMGDAADGDGGWWPKRRAGPTGNTFPRIADGLARPRMKHANQIAPAGTQGGCHWRSEPAQEFARVTPRYV